MLVKTMVTCFFLISSLFAQDQIAVTTKVFGNVEIFKKKGSSVELKQGSILSIGDQIKTSRGSFAAIIFIDDRSILKIKEKCKSLEIESLEVGNKGITFKFREGKVENISGLLAFIESDKNNIKPSNEKLFIKTKKGNPLNLSYNILKNMEKFLKKEAPS